MVYNAKGSAKERELVNWMDMAGFAVMRAPASGGATDRELPDVLVGNGDSFYAIEAKSSGQDVIYLSGEEVGELEFFAENFGAEALVGVRFDIAHGDPAYGEDTDPGWFFFDPESLYVTDGGNYRVKKETALVDGVSFAELVGASGMELVRGRVHESEDGAAGVADS